MDICEVDNLVGPALIIGAVLDLVVIIGALIWRYQAKKRIHG